MIHMLRTLIQKVDNMQEQINNVNRVMQSPRKNQKENLEIKNTVTEMKNIFDGFIKRLDEAGKNQ